MLHNCLKGINLSVSDEAEPGNAGEQPDRNNPIDWNIKEVEYKSASVFIKYSGHLCLRKLIDNLSYNYIYFFNRLSVLRWSSTLGQNILQLENNIFKKEDPQIEWVKRTRKR
jgi:hypothetical protein